MAPNYTPVFLNLGNAYMSRKKFDEAIQNYKKAIELDPKDASAFYNLGIVYKTQNKGDEAIQFYKKAIELDQN